MIIRPIRPDDSIEELTVLIRSAYKRLADVGLFFFATRQTADDTRERVAKAFTTLIAENEVGTVGTISLYTNAPESRCEHYRTAWYFGQFAVLPALQNSGIGSELVRSVEDIAARNGAASIALDTAETAYHLIDYYRKRGYTFVQHVTWDEVNYRSSVMTKVLTPQPRIESES